MGLYKLFSYNVEVQYKSCFLSKAMFFTMITTIINLLLPFIIAYKSRGFWLKSYYFYEQPTVHFMYEYLLVAETDDPSNPLVCGEMNGLHGNTMRNEENCLAFKVQEYDYNDDGKNEILNFEMHLNVPQDRTLTSIIFILKLDFQIKGVCPVHMEALAVIDKDFVTPPSGFKYYGDIQIYQISHLPCKHNTIDIRYNSSSFEDHENSHENLIDIVLGNYFMREVSTLTKTIHSRVLYGHTGSMQIQISLRVPEMKIRYIPSIMQELKWAWPQYLSLVILFYWIINKIKMFVFNNRLLLAWEVVPWKKCC